MAEGSFTDGSLEGFLGSGCLGQEIRGQVGGSPVGLQRGTVNCGIGERPEEQVAQVSASACEDRLQLLDHDGHTSAGTKRGARGTQRWRGEVPHPGLIPKTTPILWLWT